ncbi:hypothetical protein D3C78_951800 [compost metagenome]
MEVAAQAVRRHGLEIEVQGVATGDLPCLGQVLIGEQPAEFDLRQIAAVFRQHVETQIATGVCRQADAQLTAGKEIVAFAQHQRAVDQLAQLGSEGRTVELGTQADIQIAGDLGLLLQPAQAEDGGETVGIMAGEQGQADHQGNAAQPHQHHRAARAAPLGDDEQQG